MVFPSNILYKLLLALSCYFLTVYCDIGFKGNKLLCYTCMSDNVPEISKDIMRQTINVPDYAETEACNDPFVDDSPFQNGVRIEPCATACVKVVSENKYLKVVLRGCLNKLYNHGYLGFPLPDSIKSYKGKCDVQKQPSSGIGDTFTATCLCLRNYCNGASSTSGQKIGLLISVVILVLFWSLCERV